MPINELMYVNWQGMIKPDKMRLETTRTYGKFVCEPLERGFGVTLGNTLRRVILSSLYGSSIVSVKFDSVEHEFSVIPGVIEDVSEILLNLKEVRLRFDGLNDRTVRIDKVGEGVITAADIISDGADVEVLNPNLHIATLTGNAELKLSMLVRVGKGYSPAEVNKSDEDTIGTIPIDAVFSPIKRVACSVGNARVGQKTDYDKLTLEVWTDGSIVPEDAVAYAAKIIKEQVTVFINFDEQLEPKHCDVLEEAKEPAFNENLYRGVGELELSVRSANCLKNAEIHRIYQLVQKSESEMLKTKNFGRKSLNEIKEVLSDMGLSLGMKLEDFDPSKKKIDERGEHFDET